MLIPHVHEVISFKEALKYAESMDIRLIPYELAKGMQETKEILAAIEPGQSIGIFIGPEGGFEEKEVEAASEADHPRTTDPPHRDSRTCDPVCSHVPA